MLIKPPYSVGLFSERDIGLARAIRAIRRRTRGVFYGKRVSSRRRVRPFWVSVDSVRRPAHGFLPEEAVV